MARSLLALFQDSGCRVISFAAHIAAATGDTLVIACVTKDSFPRLDVVREDDDEATPLARAAIAAVAAVAATSAKVEVYDCRGRSLRRAVFDATRELEITRLILTADFDNYRRSPRGVVQKLARVAPLDVLVLDVAAETETPRRVLVPQIGGGGAPAMLLAVRAFGGPECPVIALADEGASARSNRVFTKTRARLVEARREFLEQQDVSGDLLESLDSQVTTGDFVLVDAEDARRLKRFLARLQELRDQERESPLAVGIARAAEAGGPGRLGRALERLRLFLPTLDRDERRSLSEALERGGVLSADFVVMLMLSAAIASFGLVQSSTGVVIGAMLVAPLMTPLVAAGLALVQANQRLLRSSVVAMVFGIAGALAAAAVVGLLSPWDDLSAEIVARGSPNVFDLAIAFLSGCAAAFALARPGLAGTLVGVAIAVALIPPLASVAIAAVKAEFSIALGAAVLFLTNLFAIIGGATLVFRSFGLEASRRGQTAPRWVYATVAGIALALVPITVVLVRNLQDQMTQGVQRPWANPLTPEQRAAVEARVAQSPGTEIVLMAHSGIEHGFGMQIVLACSGTPDPTLADDLRALLAESTDEPVPSRITLLRVAGSEH